MLNIINTVYTNIHTRKKEIGTQRAIGMSLKSLYKTFLWEGRIMASLAAVIGGMAGSFCAMVIQGAQTGTVTLGTPPWLPLLEAAGVSVAVCLRPRDSPAPNCTFVHCRRHRNGRMRKKRNDPQPSNAADRFPFVYSGIIRRAAASRREKDRPESPG